MRSWSRTSLTILLALTVLTGSVTPPAYAHSHPSGDRPHGHGDGKEHVDHDHSHSHHHHHGTGHHHHHHQVGQSQTSESSQSFGDSDRHWHISLVFFDLTLPTLPMPNGESGEDGKQPAVVARLVDLSRIALIQFDSSLWSAAIDAAAVDSTEAVVANLARIRRHSPPTRILLCDSARRERSGVLLT